MADSSFLKQAVEPFVVDWVAHQIGEPLTKGRVRVGHREDGSAVHFEFDGVSHGGDIGLLVSTSLSMKTGSVRKLHVDASILINAPFDRRIMAFVSNDVCLNFRNKCDGLLPLRDIEMLVCEDLPPDLRAGIMEFQRQAKAEVGDRGRGSKVGPKRK